MLTRRKTAHIPIILGQSIAKRDLDDERYCRQIALLFMPWRSNPSENRGNRTCSQYLQSTQLASENQIIVENIEIWHSCSMWKGFPSSEATWEPRVNLDVNGKICAALVQWLANSNRRGRRSEI